MAKVAVIEELNDMKLASEVYDKLIARGWSDNIGTREIARKLVKKVSDKSQTQMYTLEQLQAEIHRHISMVSEVKEVFQ